MQVLEWMGSQALLKQYNTSCLSVHPFKYAFFGKKLRVQDLLVEYVVNRHLV